MPTITVIGSVNMDLMVRTRRFPEAGETISGYDFRTIPGGKGANQAVAITRQAVRVNMVGHVGDDEFGARAVASLQAQGINTGYLSTVPGEATGVAIIGVEDSGENRIIVAPGANARLTVDEVALAEAAIAGSDALVMQLEIPVPAVAYAAHLAKQKGVRVIVNAAPAHPLPETLASAVDYLVVNETEASLLTECPPTEPREAARKLISAGFRNVIITLGEDGALFANGQHIEVVPSFKVSAVDTTAAGDAFVGAFASAVTMGKDIPEAVRWANAAGALATTVLGAQPSLPTNHSVKEFLAKHDGYGSGGGDPPQR